ncbi:MAG: bifunctional (p)ppGpp synthetase/guanosine-3',5'-bis(diphosphate) 3'-pyrophosphohydrolase, partial [Magnetococcales bacterium]|nr:bifunctional (p)ppGpp synthetase/guanosine-3',5'-bis(diphosphate) 3'-pyrophosphohydrolase [Magnetococcales bacterium]
MTLDQQIQQITALSRECWGKENVAKVTQAAEMAIHFHEGQFRKSDGAPYVTHCFDVARNCFKWGLVDVTAVCAALLHDSIEDAAPEKEAVRVITEFDPEVADIVLAVSKISNKQSGGGDDLPATYRRILRAASKDLRALLVKAFDVLDNSRTFSVHKPHKAKVKASLGLIYVGMARRLGMMELADQLIQQVAPYLMPVQYKRAMLRLEELRRLQGATIKKLPHHLEAMIGDGL